MKTFGSQLFNIYMRCFCSYLIMAALAGALHSCRTTRTAQTFTADTVATVLHTIDAATAVAQRDSSRAVSVVTIADDQQVDETITTETFDSTGTLRTRTTVERHLSRTTTANRADTLAATHTATATDTLHRTDTTAFSAHTATTAEAIKEPAATTRSSGFRLRLRWLLFGLVVAICLVGYYRFKHFSNHNYWD